MQLSLVCVLFDPAIPTSFFNFIQLFLYLCIMSQQCNDALQYTWADYNYLDQHVIDRILEMDQCHDVLIYGPIQSVSQLR